jgi:3-oxoisoapionate kinase
MSDARVSRIIVAGGDTSSHAMAALAIWGLSYRASLAPGVPLCRVHSDDPRLDGLDIVLKGGQMGPPNFFVMDS